MESMESGWKLPIGRQTCTEAMSQLREALIGRDWNMAAAKLVFLEAIMHVRRRWELWQARYKNSPCQILIGSSS